MAQARHDAAAFAGFADDRPAWLAEPKLAKPAKAGGARRDRTADLVIANDALSQLSYGPLRDRVNQTTRPTIGAIYSPRQGQVKNGEIIVLRGFCPELPLFAGG